MLTYGAFAKTDLFDLSWLNFLVRCFKQSFPRLLLKKLEKIFFFLFSFFLREKRREKFSSFFLVVSFIFRSLFSWFYRFKLKPYNYALFLFSASFFFFFSYLLFVFFCCFFLVFTCSNATRSPTFFPLLLFIFFRFLLIFVFFSYLFFVFFS